MDSTGFSPDALFWLSIYTLILGGLIVVLVIFFALALLYVRRWRWRKEPYPPEMLLRDLHHLIMDGVTRREIRTLGALAESAYAEHLSRRNEFWTSYGQVTVAILLLIVVTVLLLTRTIEPDAGLPILSAIAGFAIAKGTNSSRGGGLRPPEGEEG